MTKQELINTVSNTFPSGEMLPVEVFRDWFTDILIPQLWREPGEGGEGALPILYGSQDPNITSPTDPYSPGFLYLMTDDGTSEGNIIGLYIFNGINWILMVQSAEGDFVAYVAQTKTPAQKAIARNNLDLDFDANNIDPLEFYLNELT